MQCPSCGALAAAGSPKCAHCGRELDPAANRPLAPQPGKYRVQEDGFELVISWSWFSPAVFFLIPFAIAWNAFLYGWYAMASQMPNDFGPMRMIFLLFPMGHVAVGLGLIYGIACSLVNSTRITVSQGNLQVWHGPIFFPGSLSLETSDINQIYVVAAANANSENPHPPVALKARLKDNREIPLISQIAERESALFLEQKLESYLRIADQRVAGEVAIH